MAAFNHNGYTYDIYVRKWMRDARRRTECLKWRTGMRWTWERITADEFNAAHEQYKQSKQNQSI